MFFILSGKAAYVLPFRNNIVYIELRDGEDFGHDDIVLHSINLGQNIVGILDHTSILKR